LLAGGGQVLGRVQDSTLASKAPRLKKEDGLVNWSRTAKEIFDQARALEPWPKTFTFWQRPGHEPVRLILERVETMPTIPPESAAIAAPGSIIGADEQGLVVACGEGALRIQSLQPAGKRAMSAGEFLRGHPLKVGEKLG
jgi:methionyl-tRNA formyltransferase